MREDWWRRAAYFAFYGALGWSLGGSISYMMVIGYTHSGTAVDIAYGFACLFVIGFLWAAPGGAGSVWAGVVDRDRLTEFFTPLIVLFTVWAALGGLSNLAEFDATKFAGYMGPTLTQAVGYFHDDSLSWYDSDWLAAWSAIAAMLGLAACRGRMCRASLLIFQLAVGWWLGFGLLTLLAGLRMTPPRSDNWAGMVGLVAALFWYLFRQKLTAVSWAALACGMMGGVAFTLAQIFKLLGIRALGVSNDNWNSLLEGWKIAGWNANWHSLWEQTAGAIFGVGVALVLGTLSARVPAVNDRNATRRWTEVYAVAFTLLVVTFLNIRKNVWTIWLPNHDVPETLVGLPIQLFFDLMYLFLAGCVLWLLVMHRLGRRVPLLTDNPQGRGQLLFGVFLWWIIVGNLGRLIPFHPQRLITEGVIHVGACIVTVLALSLSTRPQRAPAGEPEPFRPLFLRTFAFGGISWIAVVALGTPLIWLIYGGKYLGQAKELHRFPQKPAAAAAASAPGPSVSPAPQTQP